MFNDDELDDFNRTNNDRPESPLPAENLNTSSLLQKSRSFLQTYGPDALIVISVAASTVGGIEILQAPVALTLFTIGTVTLFGFLWQGLLKTERAVAQLKETIRTEINNNNLNYNFEFNITNKIGNPELLAKAGKIASQAGIVTSAINYVLHTTDNAPVTSLADPEVAGRTAVLFVGGACTLVGFLSYIKSGQGLFALADAKHEVEKLIFKNAIEEAQAQSNEKMIREIREQDKLDITISASAHSLNGSNLKKVSHK